MAYLDLAQHGGAATLQFPFAAAQPARDVVPGFNQREWLVIRLARDDSLSSLREESDFKQILRKIFGYERKRPLSDPRLEALRRMAVLSWHHRYNVNASAIAEFLSKGYSIDQYDVMLAHMGAERASSQKIRFQGTRR